MPLPEPDIVVEWEAETYESGVLLRLTAPCFVKGVWLSVPGQKVGFTDNAFDLVPYVSKDVMVTFDNAAQCEQVKDALKIQHCNQMPSAEAAE